MNDKYQQQNEKIKLARINKMNAELKECTFAPKLNRHKSPEPNKGEFHNYSKMLVRFYLFN